MTKPGTSIGSVSRNSAGEAARAGERMLSYKAFAAAFSYPDTKLLAFFPDERVETLVSAYDRLFRALEIWPYTAEHTAENEFQRVNCLADISGFYRAFGVEPDRERPDHLASELEFLHLLVFKQHYALNHDIEGAEEKALVTLDAQKKFFNAHLYEGARKIAGKVISRDGNGFYARIAGDLLIFLESEKRYLEKAS